MKTNKLLQEEKRSTKLFLWLFYSVFFIYDIFYYDIFPDFPWLPDSENTLWHDSLYIKYFVIIALIPLFVYLIQKDKTEYVKYILLFGYLSVNTIGDIIYYKDSPLSYSSGSIVELVIILFSPIFVNKRFTYYVTGGLI